MADLTTLTWRVADGVGFVNLDRPERHNAFDQTMCEELSALWRRLRTDDSVRAVVLGAEGGKAFCTGIDRDFVPSEGGAEYTFSPYTYDDPGTLLGPKSNELWKPVIAAVDGLACGGAFYLLGEVDFIIATEASRFFDPHVTYGMPAVYEPLLMLHRGMPFGEVLRMTLLGNHERMTARRAEEIGLVSEVVTDADALVEAATWAAGAIASAPSSAVQATLRTLWAGRELSRQQALDLGGTFLHLGMSEEALAEGQKVFERGRIEPRER
ncbi:enoyl-CoA hydratase/isomerase family protein [Iamia majanohamensis]|uniref:Enoyl-CoA hydratase/isomerase family protein n=1 Tax=Iamia majanohamensis TaxID=467976 RepID=A0AAF0BU72_9ACTN|nr:enoyl-CoA hydratase/isomerase family protein [Iamia majanohamensis]WCO65545.1 enoyl-CoA hydratase/isomerase family protein [Iamia majanohamensis]